MMKTVCLILLTFLLWACSSKVEKKVEPQLDPKVLITCEGIGEVKLQDSYDDLEKKFGDSVISEHENNRKGKYLSLWENTPKQINVYFKEKAQPFKTIKYIEATDPMSPYMTKDSIGVGMSIRDLVRKNNSMAITFRNFSASDDPGLILNFTNGTIPGSNPCLEGTLERTGQQPIDVAEMNTFNKQEEVKSYDRVLQRMEVILGTVRLSAK